MDGRISVWLVSFSLTLLAAGCVTTQSQKTVSSSGGSTVARPDDAPIVKKADGPKRTPMASTEVAFGKMKEAEADTAAARANPEAQASLRDDARKAYQQALKIDKDNLEAHRCLARLYTKMSDYDRALDIYKKALAKHPKDVDLWIDLGMCHNRICHNRNKDFTEGARCFAKALEIDPENREAMKKLGYTLAWMGQIDQGLTYLTRGHQSAALAHFRLACMFDQKEQREPAIQHLRLALRENSQLEEARELLAILEGQDGNPAQRGAVISPVGGG